jgi:hypothetical protein
MATPPQERSGVGLAKREEIVFVSQALELDAFCRSEAAAGVPIEQLVVVD